ncbi:MAG: type II toxin-antitoxin system HipA family toxin [Acidimicrobiia bacterium]
MAYTPVHVVEVLAWGRRIGAVAHDPVAGAYRFRYEDDWRDTGVELAPIGMRSDRQSSWVFPNLSENTYHRLPPLLADSLPDRFGNALTTAELTRQGVTANEITSLDRLAYVGSRGMGALEFRPARGPAAQKPTAIELSELVVAARQALTGSLAGDDETSAAFKQLLRVGTSAGGARAKAIIAWNPETGDIRSGQVPVDDGYEHWLLKLDGVGEDTDLGTSKDYGRIEYAYYLMALDAGLHMMPSRVLEEGGRAHFMTKRFDRDGNDRVHVQSLCAIAHLDFNQRATHDYAQLFDAADQLGASPEARTELFRRMAFNVAAANCDDHTKNFAFVLAPGSGWELAPAFDVTHAYNPAGEWVSQHLMSINGAFGGVTRADLLAVADRFIVPRAVAVLDQILRVVAGWESYASSTGVRTAESERVASDIASMAAPLRH